MIAQGISHTAYDTMKEYMLTGAELDGKYQIPNSNDGQVCGRNTTRHSGF